MRLNKIILPDLFLFIYLLSYFVETKKCNKFLNFNKIIREFPI